MSQERAERVTRPLNRYTSYVYNGKYITDRLSMNKKDTKLFISLVKVHECLYNRNVPSNINIRNRAWCAIATEMFPTFVDKNASQKEAIIKKLKAKLRYLLSCYEKHVDAQGAGSQGDNLNFFEHAKIMAFMKPYLQLDSEPIQNKMKPRQPLAVASPHMLPTPDNSGSSEHTTPEPSVLYPEVIFKTAPATPTSASSLRSFPCIRNTIESPTPPSPEPDQSAEYREIIEPVSQQNFNFAKNTVEQAHDKFFSFLGEMIDFIHPNHREDLKKELLLIAFDFKKRYPLQTYSSIPSIPSIQHVYTAGNVTCEEQRIGLSVRKDLLDTQSFKNV